MQEYFSYKEVATILGKSENCIAQLVTKYHKLSVVKIGKRPCVTRESMLASFPYQLTMYEHIAFLQGIINNLNGVIARQRDASTQIREMLASMRVYE